MIQESFFDYAWNIRCSGYQDADSQGIYNMKEKFQIAFFIVLLSYVAILFAGGYVSVYPTYFAIPTLAFLAIIAFGSFSKIHETAKLVFIITIVLLILTLTTVTYVGVYLPMIVGSIFVLAGIIMLITRPREK